MSNHMDMYYWDGTNFVPWGGTVTSNSTISGGTVNVAGTVPTTISAGTVGISGTVPTTVAGTPTVSLPGTSAVTVSGTPTVETPAYTTVKSGELAIGTAAGGTTTASIACKLVRFKARSSNAGTVYIGGGTTITTPDGTTDVTTGMGMIASDDTGWIPASNVANFVFISSGTANAVTYLAVL